MEHWRIQKQSSKFGDDRKVLEFALAYEQITEHLRVQPKLVEKGNLTL